MAERTNSNKIVPLATAIGFSSNLRTQYQREVGPIRESTLLPARFSVSAASDGVALTVAISHPGIDEDVEDIDEEVHDHIGGGDEHHRPLDHRKIAPANALDDESPHAGNGEHRF